MSTTKHLSLKKTKQKTERPDKDRAGGGVFVEPFPPRPPIPDAKRPELAPFLGKMLTVGEVAARLNCSHRTVRAMVDKGKLHAIELGNTLRLYEAEVTAYLTTPCVPEKNPDFKKRLREGKPFNILNEIAMKNLDEKHKGGSRRKVAVERREN